MPNQPHKLLLPLLFIGVLMGAIDLAIIGPALPAIQGDFGMRENQLAMLMNAYVLCQLLGTPLLAKLSDRFGPRAIYIASIGMFAGGSLLIAAAGSPMMMYVGRALQGFGAGGIFPVATAVIATRIPDEQRGPALGILGMVFGMAFLVGPILGGLLLPFGWQWLFLINLPIAAVLIAGAIRLLPTDGSDGKQPFDRAGATLLAIGLTAFVLGLNELDTGDIVASLTSWPVGGALALSLLVAPLFWRIEKRAADPIIAPRFFASRQIVRACVLSAGVGGLQSGSVFGPALLVIAAGVAESTAAWLMIPGVIVSTLMSPVIGKLINRVGSRTLILLSMSLLALSLAIYAFVELGVVAFVIANLISGLAMAGLLGAPLRFIVLGETHRGDHAAGQALLSVATSVGRLIGAALVGTIATSAGGGVIGYQAAFLAMTVIAVALLAVGWSLRKAGTSDAAEATATA